MIFKKNLPLIILWAAMTVVLASIFWLYGFNMEPVFLASLITLAGLALWMLADTLSWKRQKRLMEQNCFDPSEYSSAFRPFVQKIQDLEDQLQREKARDESQKKELCDTFGLWAHQIKLPVSAISLMIQSHCLEEETLKVEMERIEQSVAMAMGFMRLESLDDRMEHFDLQEVILPIVRRRSPAFIRQKITLNYEPESMNVLCDSKWVSFMAEQLLDNALKYTPQRGTITINTKDNILSIENTGSHIEEEDLPRIFDQGFTGKNGHEHQSVSSGLGLYVCKKTAERLGLQLDVNNTDQGVKAAIRFQAKERMYE